MILILILIMIMIMKRMIKTKMINDHFDETKENGFKRENNDNFRLPSTSVPSLSSPYFSSQVPILCNPSNRSSNVFLGFFLTLNNIPVYMQWLSYVAYVRYGFEGTMMVSMFDSGKKNQCSIRVGACHATIKNTNRDANTGNIRVRAGEACVQPGLLPLQIPTQVS